MPLLEYQTEFRTRQSLSFIRTSIRHCLLLGDDNVPVVELKGPLPMALATEVFSRSNITAQLSVIHSGVKLAANETKDYFLVKRFLWILRQNADLLSITNISPLSTGGDCSALFHFTPRHSTPPTSQNAAVSLVSFNIDFDVRSEEPPDGTLENIADHALVDRVVETIIMRHFVKLYPSVFGNWGEILSREMTFFSSISRSLLSMANRSSNRRFRSDIKNIIKELGVSALDSEHVLAGLLEGVGAEHSAHRKSRPMDLTDNERISLSLRCLYKKVIRPLAPKCKLTPMDSFESRLNGSPPREMYHTLEDHFFDEETESKGDKDNLAEEAAILPHFPIRADSQQDHSQDSSCDSLDDLDEMDIHHDPHLFVEDSEEEIFYLESNSQCEGVEQFCAPKAFDEHNGQHSTMYMDASPDAASSDSFQSEEQLFPSEPALFGAALDGIEIQPGTSPQMLSDDETDDPYDLDLHEFQLYDGNYEEASQIPRGPFAAATRSLGPKRQEGPVCDILIPLSRGSTDEVALQTFDLDGNGEALLGSARDVSDTGSEVELWGF